MGVGALYFMPSRARPTAAETGSVPNVRCSCWRPGEAAAGWERGRLCGRARANVSTDFVVCDGGVATVAAGFVACSTVSVALGGALTGGLGGGDEFGVLRGRTVVSLRISASRMGGTSDCMGR